MRKADEIAVRVLAEFPTKDKILGQILRQMLRWRVLSGISNAISIPPSLRQFGKYDALGFDEQVKSHAAQLWKDIECILALSGARSGD